MKTHSVLLASGLVGLARGATPLQALDLLDFVVVFADLATLTPGEEIDNACRDTAVSALVTARMTVGRCGAECPELKAALAAVNTLVITESAIVVPPASPSQLLAAGMVAAVAESASGQWADCVPLSQAGEALGVAVDHLDSSVNLQQRADAVSRALDAPLNSKANWLTPCPFRVQQARNALMTAADELAGVQGMTWSVDQQRTQPGALLALAAVAAGLTFVAAIWVI